MKIVVYTTDDPDVPENLRFLAYVLVPGFAKSAKGRDEFLPVRYGGATKEAVTAAAQAHHDAEQAKAAKEEERVAKAEAKEAAKAAKPAGPGRGRRKSA